MVMWNFPPQACAFTFIASCRLFNICCDPAVLVQSLVVHTRSLFVDTNLQKCERLAPCEWARNHGGSLQRVCSATDGRLFWFCLLWRLTTFPLGTSLCRCLLDHCDFFKFLERQLDSQASLFPFLWQRRSYRIRVLKAIDAAEQKGSGLWD